MPRWVLACPSCKNEFTHGEIGTTLKDYYFPTKPSFPAEGLNLECPSCKKTSLFRQHQLLYRAGERWARP
jgi:hypothetical protein